MQPKDSYLLLVLVKPKRAQLCRHYQMSLPQLLP
jgi:hypothetical protein